MITFKSVGHFFAKSWKALKDEEPKVESALVKIEQTKGTVETVTAAVPQLAALIPVEDVAYALLGEFSAVLSAGDAAAKQKLVDAGLDVNVVNTVENLLKTAPQIVAVAKTL